MSITRRAIIGALSAISLGRLFQSPASASGAAIPKPQERLPEQRAWRGALACSEVYGDAAYRDWCILRGDGWGAEVMIDGLEQKYALAADTEAGRVWRVIETAEGNMAHDGHEVLTEEVRGRVEIILTRRTSR